jgi:hypothetical protein
MIARRIGLACALAALAMGGAGQALACSIMMPTTPPQLPMMPNEPEADYRARAELHQAGFIALQEKEQRERVQAHQRESWDGSRAVAVVEVLSRQEIPIGPPGQAYGSGAEVRLRVASWLKGSIAGGARLTLAQKDFTSCGPSPNWSVFLGWPGQRFVLFFGTGRLAQDDVRDVVAAADIREPQVIAAIAARAR